MSTRRPTSEADIDETHRSSSTWRPVALIQVDIDGPPDTVPLDVPPGNRMWIEAVKQGQVVGVLEARAEDDGLSAATRKELVETFSDNVPSSLESPPNRLLPRASVIIPTICRIPSDLVRTVKSLLTMDYPDFEIIVVDNRAQGDHDPLPDFSGDSRVRVTTERTPGISAARNRGVAIATGDFVAFTDDDAVAAQDWLRVLASRFALNEDVGAIGGLVLPKELETAPQLWFEEFYGGFSRSFRTEYLSVQRLKDTDDLFPYTPGRFGAGCNMAFRRSTLERMGGFDASLGTGTPARGGEDLAMFVEFLVSGGTVAFEPAALVRHSHRRTEREFMKQVFGYGIGLTAMYTAIIARNPRHLTAMLRRIPAGLRHLTRPREQRSPSRAPSYPRRTLWYQVLGMAYGPIAYARSIARTRWFT